MSIDDEVVRIDEKTCVFRGTKYKKNRYGYFVASYPRKRGKSFGLHRVIWEAVNGPIPPNHHIHHMDGDKSNYSIGNLLLMTKSDHQRLHGMQFRGTPCKVNRATPEEKAILLRRASEEMGILPSLKPSCKC